MTLDEFLAYQRRKLVEFERDWRAHNAVNPEHYPLSLPDTNQGLWFEMYDTFEPPERKTKR